MQHTDVGVSNFGLVCCFKSQHRCTGGIGFDERHYLRDLSCYLFVCTGLEEQVGKASLRHCRQQHARAVQEQQRILADCMPRFHKAHSRSKKRKIRCRLFVAYECIFCFAFQAINVSGREVPQLADQGTASMFAVYSSRPECLLFA